MADISRTNIYRFVPKETLESTEFQRKRNIHGNQSKDVLSKIQGLRKHIFLASDVGVVVLVCLRSLIGRKQHLSLKIGVVFTKREQQDDRHFNRRSQRPGVFLVKNSKNARGLKVDYIQKSRGVRSAKHEGIQPAVRRGSRWFTHGLHKPCHGETIGQVYLAGYLSSRGLRLQRNRVR